MQSRRPILVTGASGFIGREVAALLLARGHAVRGVVPSATSRPVPGAQTVHLPPEADADAWDRALEGAAGVVHVPGRMQRLDARGRDPGPDFWLRARDQALLLGERAAAQGVERLVFLSTATVHGPATPHGPVDEDAPLAPATAYARAKLETEQGLGEVAAGSRLGLTVLRPPLVYGPEVRGNFLRLLKLVDRGLPLPLGLVRNRRSMLFMGNLADAMATCLAHPNAPGRTFLPTDGEAVSTPELVRLMARALGRPARLAPVPAQLVRAAFAAMGRSRALGPLLGSFVVDASRIRREIDWTPPFTMAEGVAETVDWLRHTAG